VPALSPRKVLAVGLGNALEFYDFVTYSYFAIQIGHAFFPPAQTSHGLVYSLATFGVGFLTRPLGAWLIGRYGDRVGRRPAMLWSFGLMGGGILALALTPSYAHIGRWAPALLVTFRLLQGLAIGGEVGPSTAFLVEAAPPERRGLYVALQLTTQYAAGVAAAVIGFLLSGWLSPAALDAWGWRVAFLAGIAVVPVGLYIRRSLPETLITSSSSHSGHTGPTGVSASFLVAAFLLAASGTTAVYVVDFMNTYAQDALGLSAHIGFTAAIIESVTVVCVAPVAGLLSDRFGRKPVMLTALGLLLLSAVPSYLAITTWRTVPIIYAATGLLSALEALLIAPAMTAISESLPQAVRSTSFGLVYAAGVTMFGGFAQLIVKSLMDATHNPDAPGFYLAVMLVVGCLAALTIRESAPRRVEQLARPSLVKHA
jgi:MHS family citrate/tricarballylate:H+ symporter-like MFS transporter